MNSKCFAQKVWIVGFLRNKTDNDKWFVQFPQSHMASDRTYTQNLESARNHREQNKREIPNTDLPWIESRNTSWTNVSHNTMHASGFRQSDCQLLSVAPTEESAWPDSGDADFSLALLMKATKMVGMAHLFWNWRLQQNTNHIWKL